MVENLEQGFDEFQKSCGIQGQFLIVPIFYEDENLLGGFFSGYRMKGCLTNRISFSLVVCKI